MPVFVFCLHAGGSPLSVGRLAAALPPDVGILVANLPRGRDEAGVPPPRRATVAAEGVASALAALCRTAPGAAPERLVLVGNSYGALLAYEVAWSLIGFGVPTERLIVSGFRSPALPPADAPLHGLPSDRLWDEVTARFGGSPGDERMMRDHGVETSLRADLEACETYRHDHAERLPIPIDVLRMSDDPSVDEHDLRAWRSVTTAPVRLVGLAGGHFPWATQPGGTARVLLELADLRNAGAPLRPDRGTQRETDGSIAARP